MESVRLTLRGAVLRGRRVAPGTVAVADGRIAEGVVGPVLGLPEGWTVAPGMVDLQVNGYAGDEVGDGPDAHRRIARALARDGVTAYCPTLVSRDDAGYRDAAAALAGTRRPADGARSAGVHLEGPFLNPARAGAHRRRVLGPAGGARVAALAELLSPRIVTLAPEVEGGVAAVRLLARRGVLVSMGHTEAGAAVVAEAVRGGLRMVTHALNAMPGVTARGPDGLAAALADRRVAIGVIGDGVHVGPAALAALRAAAGPRLVLVSDAVAAAAAPPGAYRLAGVPVTSDGTTVRDAAGRLAGAAAPLWRGVGGLRAAGAAPAAALAAATTAPRRLLGLPGLAPGDPADLVVVDAAGRVRCTLVAGVPCGPHPAEAIASG